MSKITKLCVDILKSYA